MKSFKRCNVFFKKAAKLPSFPDCLILRTTDVVDIYLNRKSNEINRFSNQVRRMCSEIITSLTILFLNRSEEVQYKLKCSKLMSSHLSTP